MRQVVVDVFVRSDHLETTNSRPIEVFFGYPDGHNGVAIEGRLRQIHAFSALPLLHGDNNNDDSSSPPPIPHPPLPSPPSIPTPPPPPSDAFLRDMYSSSDELSGEDLVDAADRLGHGERIIVIGRTLTTFPHDQCFSCRRGKGVIASHSVHF